MTVLCGGGASGPKAGVNETIIAGSAVLEEILTDSPVWWAKAAIPLVAVLTYDLLSFCATDPPSLPTFTTAEQTAIQTLNYGDDLTSGLSKLITTIGNMIWYQYCQCTSTGTPAPPTPQGQLSTVQTPGAVLLIDAQTSSSVSTFCAGGTHQGPLSGAYEYGWTTTMQEQGQLTAIRSFDTTGYSSNTYRLWVNHQLVRTVVTSGETLFHQSDWPIAPVQVTSGDIVTLAEHILTSTTFCCNSATNEITPAPHYSSNPINYQSIGTAVEPSSTTGQCYVFTDLWFQPGPSLQCCPPDPAMMALLKEIAARVGPQTYTVGTSHTVSGVGQITVSGISGVIVTAVTLPARQAYEATNPVFYFELGYVAFGDSNAWSTAHRIQNSPQLVNGAPVGTTKVGYSFPADVTMEIVELEASLF